MTAEKFNDVEPLSFGDVIAELSDGSNLQFIELTLDSPELSVNEARELAAWLAKAIPGAGWMPIETAPKDGRRIMLAHSSYVGEGYRDQQGNFMDVAIGLPITPFSHWQPLPPPPTAGE